MSYSMVGRSTSFNGLSMKLNLLADVEALPRYPSVKQLTSASGIPIPPASQRFILLCRIVNVHLDNKALHRSR